MAEHRSSEPFGTTNESTQAPEIANHESAERLTDALNKLESVASPDAYWYIDEKNGIFDRLVIWQERRKREREDARRRGAEALAIARQRERYKMRGEPRLTWDSRSQRRMSLALAGFVLGCAALGAVIGLQLRKESGDQRVAASSSTTALPGANLAPPPVVASTPPHPVPPELAIPGGDSLDAFMVPSDLPTVRISESPSDPILLPDTKVDPDPPTQNQKPGSAKTRVPVANGVNAPVAIVRPASPIEAPAAILRPKSESVVTRPVVVPPRTPTSNDRVVVVYSPPPARSVRKSASMSKRRVSPARSARLNRPPWRPSEQERRRIDRDAELAFQGEYRFEANRNRRNPSAPLNRRRDEWNLQPLSTLDPKHPNWGWD